MNLKSFVLYLLLFMTLSLEAKKIMLSFNPKAHIVVFHHSSLTFYTDSSSLLNIYSGSKAFAKQMDSRHIRSIVLTKFRESKNDTIHIADSLFTYNESLSYINYESWFDNAVAALIKQNKLKIINSEGNVVKVISTNKIRYKDAKFKHVRRVYIDESTNNILFTELLSIRLLKMF